MSGCRSKKKDRKKVSLKELKKKKKKKIVHENDAAALDIWYAQRDKVDLCVRVRMKIAAREFVLSCEFVSKPSDDTMNSMKRIESVKKKGGRVQSSAHRYVCSFFSFFLPSVPNSAKGETLGRRREAKRCNKNKTKRRESERIGGGGGGGGGGMAWEWIGNVCLWCVYDPRSSLVLFIGEKISLRDFCCCCQQRSAAISVYTWS